MTLIKVLKSTAQNYFIIFGENMHIPQKITKKLAAKVTYLPEYVHEIDTRNKICSISAKMQFSHLGQHYPLLSFDNFHTYIDGILSSVIVKN